MKIIHFFESIALAALPLCAVYANLNKGFFNFFTQTFESPESSEIYNGDPNAFLGIVMKISEFAASTDSNFLGLGRNLLGIVAIIVWAGLAYLCYILKSNMNSQNDRS